jgi:hypothetical protein
MTSVTAAPKSGKGGDNFQRHGAATTAAFAKLPVAKDGVLDDVVCAITAVARFEPMPPVALASIVILLDVTDLRLPTMPPMPKPLVNTVNPLEQA